MKQRSRPPQRRAARGTARARDRRGGAERIEALVPDWLRVVVCGVVFAALIACKLALPGNLLGLRGNLSSWLVRDADVASAFSAVGRAVSGEESAAEALADARSALLGGPDAVEVSGAAELESAEPESMEPERAEPERAEPEVTDTRDWPENASAERRVLGLDHTAPLAGEITSPFGWRTHPVSGREEFHYGADVAAEEGAAIACFADGTVGVVGESVELGKYLTVHHENGLLTLYAHCSRILAASGDAVRMGETIAEAGSTGNATGPHLHFELHDGEELLDPVLYLS